MPITAKHQPLQLKPPKYLTVPFSSESKTIDLKDVNGSSLRYELNGCTILESQYHLKRMFSTSTVNKNELMKIHFQLFGKSTYQNKASEEIKAFDQGYFNLFYLPKTTTNLVYQGSVSHSVELLLDINFLKTIVGNLNEKLTGFLKSNNKSEAVTFWDQNQPLDEKSCNLINDIKTCTLDASLKKSYLETKVIELIELLLIKKPKCISLGIIPARPPQVEDTIIQKVHTYLHKNLNKNITIPQLAQFAGINTSKLKKDYKQVYGSTIFKHLTTMRMTKAHDLLATKEMTIAHISQTVGYKNPQHFTVAFKKYYGYLPREVV